MKQLVEFFPTAAVWSLAAGLVLVTAPARAADWPQWRGPSRDGKAAEFKMPAAWPKELTKKWQVAVGDGVATPALVGDRLYVFTREGGQEITRCLDAATGKELWQDKCDAAAVSGPPGQFAGPRSSPAVAGGKVIVYGVQGTLTCLDAASGKVRWRKDGGAAAYPQFFTSSSPLIADGLCLAHLGGQDNGALRALDLATGAEKWTWTGDGAAYASPVLATVDGVRVVIAQSDKRLVALGAADGKLLWETPYAGSGRGGYNTATPIVDGSTLIYSGPQRGVIAAKLEKQGDGLTATELWRNADNSVQYNSPVLHGGLIYGLSAQDSLFCLSRAEGKTAWVSPVPGKRGFGSIVDAGPVLFLLTPAGSLVAFEPSDKEFKQLASYKVSETETHAHPVVDGSRIFIKDKTSVTLWTIE